MKLNIFPRAYRHALKKYLKNKDISVLKTAHSPNYNIKQYIYLLVFIFFLLVSNVLI